MSLKKRCPWVGDNPLMIAYHDHEWGTPTHDDRLLFEMILLEGAQAGLSWSTVLNKRKHYQKVFYKFNPSKMAKMTKSDIEKLVKDAGIIRHRGKIEAFISNAILYNQLFKSRGSFSKYIWSFVEGQPIINHFKTTKDFPTRSIQSDNLSRDLKKKGFKFVGTTICYAFMQAVGMTIDHTTDCFRYSKKHF